MSSRAKLYYEKWRWYERNSLPWRRARIHLHMLRAEAFIRFPIQEARNAYRLGPRHPR